MVFFFSLREREGVAIKESWENLHKNENRIKSGFLLLSFLVCFVGQSGGGQKESFEILESAEGLSPEEAGESSLS